MAWINLESGRISYKAYDRTTEVSTELIGKQEPDIQIGNPPFSVPTARPQCGDRSTTPARILYCGGDGMIHIHDLTTSNETIRYIPVPGYGCTGPLVYDSTTGVLTFVLSQNGLYAIGELSGLN